MKNKLKPLLASLKKNFPEPDDLVDIWDTKTGKKITLKEVMKRKIDNENKS